MKVLDKGYVKLVDVMGDDMEPVRAARVSFNGGLRGDERDEKLLRSLMRRGHTSPFEMIELKWEIKAPIFVARQWVRHRTANWNEVSYRYTEILDEFYTRSEFHEQHTAEKQASAALLDDQASPKYYLERAQSDALYYYRQLLSLGVSREEARDVLPLTTYTKWFWKNDMHNTLRFLELRTGSGAQPEIREYANAMIAQLEERFPIIINLWKETLDNS